MAESAQAGVSVAGPLAGVRVLDVSTLFAGPLIATIMADFGAEVTKIEHPTAGDPARGHGPAKNGVALMWTALARNKKAITLYLGAPEGQEIFRQLVGSTDIVIENFRPGTLERWNLGYQELSKLNEGLILVRVSGFGQFGPYSHRPGFGTLAEAMSGFAHLTGPADGPPTLPPFGLADGTAALAGAAAVMFALYHRDARGGAGQVVDVTLIEPLLTVLGAQPTIFDQLGVLQSRNGNRSGNNAPRNTYRCKDGDWVAVSTSATSVAERVMRLVGHPEVVAEPWFNSGHGRADHADILDRMVAEWVEQRPLDEVLLEFERADAAIAPVYDTRSLMEDPQIVALDAITTVADPELGMVKMQNVMFRLSETPGQIKWTGRPLGADNEEVYRDGLGLSAERLAELQEKRVI